MQEAGASRNWVAAVFIVRSILGVLFFVAGFYKVFQWGVAGHIGYFHEQLGDSILPGWLLTVSGAVIPFWELAAGALLLIGLKSRIVLISLGVLLIITTFGHALMEPLFDIDGHTFTRLALIIFLLLAPAGCDKWSLDHKLLSR